MASAEIVIVVLAHGRLTSTDRAAELALANEFNKRIIPV